MYRQADMSQSEKANLPLVSNIHFVSTIQNIHHFLQILNKVKLSKGGIRKLYLLTGHVRRKKILTLHQPCCIQLQVRYSLIKAFPLRTQAYIVNYIPWIKENLLTAQNQQELSMKDYRDTQEACSLIVDLLSQLYQLVCLWLNSLLLEQVLHVLVVVSMYLLVQYSKRGISEIYCHTPQEFSFRIFIHGCH